MNSVVLGGQLAGQSRGLLVFIWETWRALRWRQWGITLLLATVISLVVAPSHFEAAQLPGWAPRFAVAHVLAYFFVTVIVFLGSALADAGDDRWRSRPFRMTLAVVVSSALSALVVSSLWTLSGGTEWQTQLMATKGKSMPPAWLFTASSFINTLMLASLIIGVSELARRRQLTRQRIENALHDHTLMAREVLESRLAAMQAQVEPHFLFDSLVDIERLYGRDPRLASEILDRLISYLRAALPRLRDSGSTIDAELELVDAYLGVVHALHDGRPIFRASAAFGSGSLRFYPMLLLPLIQHAVRVCGDTPPESIRVVARAEANVIAIDVDITAPGLCSVSPEVERVRERLNGLYGSRATLGCVESGDVTRFELRAPAEIDGSAQRQ